jgi:hypothetical protein
VNPELTRRHNLLWGVRRSILYHTRRRMFYDRMGMWASACGVLLGSSVVVTTLQSLNEIALRVMALLTAIFSLINLVVGSSGKARQHHDLVRKFTKLESDIICKPTPSEQDISELECRRLEIEAEEPPKLAVLDVICHNELLVAEGRDLDDYCDVGPIQRILSDVGDWRASALRTRRQKAEEAAHKSAAKAKPAAI